MKNAQSLEDQIKGVYDWKAVVLGAPNDKQSERSFILGLGRTKVYMLEKNSNFWRRLDELVKFELSPNTLLYGEVVTEYRGERHSQRKVKNVHIIDAFVLGGEDISQKHFRYILIFTIECCLALAFHSFKNVGRNPTITII